MCVCVFVCVCVRVCMCARTRVCVLCAYLRILIMKAHRQVFEIHRYEIFTYTCPCGKEKKNRMCPNNPHDFREAVKHDHLEFREVRHEKCDCCVVSREIRHGNLAKYLR